MKTIKEFIKEDRQMLVSSMSQELTKEVQGILKEAGLYAGAIDGIPGDETQDAVADFKAQVYLGMADTLGKTTAEALLDYLGECSHPVTSEQHQTQKLTVLDASVVGTKTGLSSPLPSGKTVYENEYIVPGIPLTWGEMTKGMSRIPIDKNVEKRIHIITKRFGEIRDKFGSPIAITSGYRPPVVNRRIGGAKFSRHIAGDAIDIYPMSGSLSKLWEVVRGVSTTGGLGDGRRKSFIHCDCRPNDVVVIFGY